MLRALIALSLCIGLSLAGASIDARAQATQAPIPELDARVTDTTATLDAAAIQRIEASLAALEAGKGSQIAVLIVPTTGAETIEQYALRAFEQWKLGRKGVDDGVLLVVAKDDRNVRIEVGYGLEGAIPDVAAYRVIQEYLVPRFRENDFAGGIEAAVGALSRLVQGETLPAPMTEQSPGSGSFDLGSLAFFAVFVAIMARNLLARLPRGIRALATAAVTAGAVWFLLSPPWLAVVATAVIAFVVGLLTVEAGRYARSGSTGSTGGGWGSGGSGGGWSGGGGGGWSGGGGRSGGGGASGSW